MSAPAYIVVTPVKDEQEFIEKTLSSMAAQTRRPARWVIVDDGSQDQTAEIVRRWAAQHDWMELIARGASKERQPGSPVVRAFEAGWAVARRTPHEYVVKLDGDLRLPPDYFERLLGEFDRDPRLGIASGIYVENGHPVEMPSYHAAGASKVIRARCFEEIGGFVPARGWDTVDEIRAQHRGWKTRHFPALLFDHLRIEGSARGALYTNRLHGEVYYLTGGPLLFFLFKVLHRVLTARPLGIAGLMLMAGYLKPLLSRRKRLVSAGEAASYRRAMNRRIWESLGLMTRREA